MSSNRNRTVSFNKHGKYECFLLWLARKLSRSLNILTAWKVSKYRKILTRNNFVFGQFSCSICYTLRVLLWPIHTNGNICRATCEAITIFSRMDSIYNEIWGDHEILVEKVRVRNWVKKRKLKLCTLSHIGYCFKIFL